MRFRSKLLLLFALACDAPRDALVTRCKRAFLGPIECGISAEVLSKNQTASIDTETKNLRVNVKGSFSIREGRAVVVILGCPERGRINVDARTGAVPIECVAEVNRNTFHISVDTFASGGDSKGLVGTLTLTPR